MDRDDLGLLNEREWRQYLVAKVDAIHEAQAEIIAWNLVFRVVGGALFALLLVLIETK